MQAVVLERFGDPASVLRLVDLPEPAPPGAGEVLIAMLASPINPADLLLARGQYHAEVRFPAVAGMEGMCRVVGVGPEASPIQVGDLVLAPDGGVWRERQVVRAAELTVLPAGIDVRQAAMLGVNPATAALMLDTAPLAPGDWIIQSGASSATGQYVAQLAHARGLRTVNLVRRAETAAAVREAGGDVVLVENQLSGGLGGLADAVRTATGGAPIRLALDCIAGPMTLALANAVAEGGVIVVFGGMSGQPSWIGVQHLIFRGITLRGFWLRSALAALSQQAKQALYANLADLVAKGTLRADIAAVFPLTRIGEAVSRSMASARGGKVLLTA